MSTESLIPSNHLILYCPLLLLPSVFPSIRVFINEMALHIRCQRTRASALASVLPVNIQHWFLLGLSCLISLPSKGVSRIFCSTIIQKHQFFSAQPPLWSNFYIRNDYWKNHSFDYVDLCWQSDVSFLICSLGLSYLFFQGASILILWLQSRLALILEPKKTKSVTVSTSSHLVAMKGWDQMPKTI